MIRCLHSAPGVARAALSWEDAACLRLEVLSLSIIRRLEAVAAVMLRCGETGRCSFACMPQLHLQQGSAMVAIAEHTAPCCGIYFILYVVKYIIYVLYTINFKQHTHTTYNTSYITSQALPSCTSAVRCFSDLGPTRDTDWWKATSRWRVARDLEPLGKSSEVRLPSPLHATAPAGRVAVLRSQPWTSTER